MTQALLQLSPGKSTLRVYNFREEKKEKGIRQAYKNYFKDINKK
jgi:hypothetical protein